MTVRPPGRTVLETTDQRDTPGSTSCLGRSLWGRSMRSVGAGRARHLPNYHGRGLRAFGNGRKVRSFAVYWSGVQRSPWAPTPRLFGVPFSVFRG
jgi:hypothetical protein